MKNLDTVYAERIAEEYAPKNRINIEVIVFLFSNVKCDIKIHLLL